MEDSHISDTEFIFGWISGSSTTSETWLKNGDNITIKKIISRFHLGYIPVPTLKQQKTIIKETLKYMGIVFSRKKLKCVRKAFKNNSSHVIVLLMFNECRNITFFKVLGSVIYCIIEKYICLYSMCLQLDRLSSNDNTFQYLTVDHIFLALILLRY